MRHTGDATATTGAPSSDAAGGYGQPVTLADDVAHLEPTQRMSAEQAWAARKVPAHRLCHVRNAPSPCVA